MAHRHRWDIASVPNAANLSPYPEAERQSGGYWSGTGSRAGVGRILGCGATASRQGSLAVRE